MNEDRSFERLFADRMHTERGSAGLPDAFYDEFRQRARGMRQRPRWLALIKESPMRTSNSLTVGSPTARVAAIMAATLLLALMVAGAGIAGSRLLAADGAIVVDPSGGGTVETITEALAMAADGDTIVIKPGTYIEAVVIDKDVTLRGDGADRSAVVIQVPADAPLLPEDLASRCLMGCSGLDDPRPTGLLLLETTSSLSNLTVVGLLEGTAVSIHGGAPTLDDLAIEIAEEVADPSREAAGGGRGGGLHIDHASQAIVRGIAHEGWLSVDRGSSPIFEDNQLLDSCVQLWGEGTAAELRRNTITGCLNGWALDIGHGATPLIEDNDISVAGIYVYQGIAEGTHPIIRGNRIHGSDPMMEIKGIRIDCSSGSPPQARRCTSEDGVAGATATIEDNEIFDNSPGLSIFTDAIVRGNDIHDNSIGVTVSEASPILEGNTIGANQVGLEVSGIDAEPSLSGNVICDNTTNVDLVSGAELTDTSGNEICADAIADASE